VGELTELEGAVMSEATGALVSLPLRNALTSYYIELSGTQPGGKVRYSASLALFEDVICLDDFDPNDAPTDATPLEVDPETGALRLEGLESCGEDLDHYLIAAPPNKGLRVRIEREVGSPGLVPALALLQEQGDGTFVSVGTSRTRVSSAQVLLGNTTVQGGRYVAAVLPPGGLVSRYTLEVELVEPFCERNDEYEPSSDAQPASLLFSPAEPYLCPGEVDVYEVLARAGESLEVSVSGLPSALIDVRRADGASLAEGVSGTFRQTLAQGGPIRIRVRSSNMAAQGAYSLRSSAVVGAPSNDACAGATPLEVGQEVRGRISQANDDAVPTGCFVLPLRSSRPSASPWSSSRSSPQALTASWPPSSSCARRAPTGGQSCLGCAAATSGTLSLGTGR
jgi:hypothetical protein